MPAQPEEAAISASIEHYGLIGDCETAALVGRSGSIDWLCWPRFDSDACFAALLGTPEHGRWLIAPEGEILDTTRRYRGDTLILETLFETAEGAVRLIDFMPVRGVASDIVRLVVGERGRVAVRTELVLRFGYGEATPWVTRIDGETLKAVAGPDMVVLRTPVPVEGEDLKTVGRFVVSAGESVPFVLTYAPSHLALPEAIDPWLALEETQATWADWAGRCAPTGAWTEAVRRSLLTLKALTHRPTGGIVAAPTTSLPERIGGERNWDYRFCWLRDATLTLLALANAGYADEAEAWRGWLLRAVAGSPNEMQIMYGVGGERRLTEWEAGWLPGYENSRPVRIGNAAHRQLQIDVFGEVLDALHQGRRAGLQVEEAGWRLERSLLDHLADVWREPDSGIWEMRGEPRHFTYSKALAWVAFDRALKDADAFGLDGPVERWRAIRDEIHAEVCARGFDANENSFVQSYGSTALDASLLLLPGLGFLPADDPRIVGTVAAVERRLLRNGLVLRYDTASGGDGLSQGEGAFLACSFWLVDAYVALGRTAEALGLFERLLALRNDLGLLAEEYDPVAGRQLGNFPQAFSHIALVNSALNLARAEKPVHQRRDGAAETP